MLSHSYDNFVAAVRQKGRPSLYNEEEKKMIEQTINILSENARTHRYEQQTNGETQSRLQEEINQHLQDQKDIFQYLNGELNKKTDEIIKLEKNLNQARSPTSFKVKAAADRLFCHCAERATQRQSDSRKGARTTGGERACRACRAGNAAAH